MNVIRHTSMNYLHHSLPRKGNTMLPKPPKCIPWDYICSESINIFFFFLFFFLPDHPNPFKKAQPSLQKRTYCNVFKFCSETQENQPEERKGNSATSAKRNGTNTPSFVRQSPQKCNGRVSSHSGSSGETEAGTCKAIVKAAKTDPIASMQSSPGDD